VCWGPAVTPVVNDSASAASIINGGGLTIEDTLTLAATGEASNLSGTLTIESGSLDSSSTIDLTGAFAWSSGENSADIKQTGGNAFKITGGYQIGGSVIETTSPVEIEGASFISNGSTLKTTSTVKFGPGNYPPNGGTSLKMTAAGYITTGATAVPNYELNLTGNSSKIEGGTFAVPILNTEAGTTMTVSSGASVFTTGGKISGKVTGAGGYGTTAYTTTLESGGTLSTASAKLEGGTLDVKSGAKYEVGGETQITGGYLELAGAGSTGAFKLASGGCSGAGPLTVTGSFTWESGDCSLSMNQTGAGAFKVIGTHQAYQTSGSVIETTSPVEIESKEFISNGSTLKTTSTVKFAPGSYPGNGGDSEKITAAGYITTGATAVPNYELNLTGNASKIEGGLFAIPALNTEAGTTMTVSSGASVSTSGGKISGKIAGAGGYIDAGYTTTLEPGATLSTATATFEAGTFDVKSGAKYEVGGETQITGGYLELAGAGSTGAFKLAGGGCSGAGPLTVTGSFTWESGDCSLSMNQTGGGAFKVIGTHQAYQTSGSVIETTSPVEIESKEFISNGSTLKTTSTVKFAPGNYPQNGGASEKMYAAGYIITGNTSVPNYNLHMTGGTTTIPSGDKLAEAPMTIEGGETLDEGELEPAGTLDVTGGTLAGNGIVRGSLTNTSGVVEPGDGAPGQLYVSGEYNQEAGGMLAIRIKGFLPDTGYAQVQVKGRAMFAGKLSLTDEGGYVPELVHELEVVKSEQGNSGAFSELVGPSAGLYTVSYQTSGALSGAWLMAKPPLAPTNTEAPKISGTPAAGQTLRCSTGIWTNSPTKYEYEWSLDGTPIGGATDDEYEVPAGDEGHTLTCTVTASNAGGPGTPVTSEGTTVIVPPVNITAPTVSGIPATGETLTCSTGTWSGGPTGFTYQWDRAGVPIGGATSNTYLVQPGDEGQTLTCVVTASNGASAGILATSTGVSVATPVTPPASSVVSTVARTPVVPTPLPLQCSGKAIVLVSVRQVGASVFLSGIALPKYAGQKVTITLSGVSKKLAKGKGGTAIVATNGTFEAKLAAPSGAGAGLTRYTATVAGNASLALKLSRALKITADLPVAGGARVSFLVTGALGSGKHIVTITRQVSCSETVAYKKVKLPSSGRLELVLPAPKGAGEVSYYRAQTHIAHGNTFSLFVPVANDG
jgi:hypothetical protein